MLYPQPVPWHPEIVHNKITNDYHSLSLTNNQQMKLPLKVWKWPCLSPRPKLWHGLLSVLCVDYTGRSGHGTKRGSASGYICLQPFQQGWLHKCIIHNPRNIVAVQNPEREREMNVMYVYTCNWLGWVLSSEVCSCCLTTPWSQRRSQCELSCIAWPL